MVNTEQIIQAAQPKIADIEAAILRAECKESNLDAETLAIGGMTGEKIRHLMNNLGAISSNYFEIGTHRGSLYFSTIQSNSLDHAICCDDFSQFNTDGAEAELDRRIATYAGNTKLRCLKCDCFEVKFVDEWKPDLYLYDGNHGLEETKRGITHFAPMMADQFILCVDDFGWSDVQKGTRDGINESELLILAEWRLGTDNTQSDPSGYWNGYYVALLQKTK